MENIIVDSISNLWVFNNVKMDYEEWVDKFTDKINEHTGEPAWNYTIKVNHLKKLPSGNYKINAEIEGDLYLNVYTVDVLLDPNGNIIKIRNE
jgi:hypothetical protein